MKNVAEENAWISARVRWGVYLLLIAIAVGNMTGRLLAVNSLDRIQLETARVREALDRARSRLADQGLTDEEIDARWPEQEARIRDKLRQQRPFLSANDRSRWLTIRSLVEQGTYEIDAILEEPTWDTIDKVRHIGTDGQEHFYSSKPPLLSTLLAGEYWLIHRLTGATLATHPYETDRFMLMTVNVLPLTLMFVLMGQMVERLGMTDWGRIFVMASATLGTFLNTFAVVLNNHVIAAVTAAIALYAAVRVLCDGERRLSLFALAGVAAALTAADDLPALTLLVFLGGLLAWRAPRQTLLAFVPAAAVVVAAFFVTNWLAHHSLTPPYAHPEWYDYEGSHWRNRQGIDVGEPSRAAYAFHVLVGHHGIFSLTPIWLLSIWGTMLWLKSDDPARHQMAAMVVAISIVCLVFYIGLRPQHDRNYGGMTSGFRWVFWCAPLWLIIMIPAADRLVRSTAGMALAALLLTLSVISASYPTWNPWIYPWLYNWMTWCGWQGF